MGQSRRVALTLGNGVTQSVHDGTTYSGLDRFGRLIDLHFKDNIEDTIHRYQYGYDKSGNRTHARTTQAMVDDDEHENDRSYLYTYDGLQRLILSQFGQLNFDNTALAPAAGIAQRKLTWELDTLGNWDLLARDDDAAGDGTFETTAFTAHDVNKANEITNLFTDPDNQPFIHDPNGNLVFDGGYVYQYDAWNRLLQVNQAGTFTTADFNSSARIAPLSVLIYQ